MHIYIYLITMLILMFTTGLGYYLVVVKRRNILLQEELGVLRKIYTTTPDAVMISRLSDGQCLDVNEVFLELMGYTRQELLGNNTIKINLWVLAADRRFFVQQLLMTGVCENHEFKFRRKDGRHLLGLMSARLIHIKGVPHIVSITRDVTERRLAQVALQESEELYRSILNAFPDNITITDLHGNILVVSPAARVVFGCEPAFDYTSTTIADYIVPEDLEHARHNIKCMHDGTYKGPNVYRGLRNDKKLIDIEVHSSLIRDARGSANKMVFIVRDISERKRAEQKIKDLVCQLEMEKRHAQSIAMTDKLTGLANRRYFDEALLREFYRFKRSGGSFSLILLDIDHFKKFNDTYGHVAGDECLKQVAETLQMAVGRRPDVLARYGGVEFVVILPDTGALGAMSLAERIRLAIANLEIHHPTFCSEFLTVSLGVVTAITEMFPKPEDIVKLADQALYRAKENGRNRIVQANA